MTFFNVGMTLFSAGMTFFNVGMTFFNVRLTFFHAPQLTLTCTIAIGTGLSRPSSPLGRAQLSLWTFGWFRFLRAFLGRSTLHF